MHRIVQPTRNWRLNQWFCVNSLHERSTPLGFYLWYVASIADHDKCQTVLRVGIRGAISTVLDLGASAAKGPDKNLYSLICGPTE